MNDKKGKEAYFNLKVPDELKTRILNEIEQTEKSQSSFYWKTAFCCFIAIIMVIGLSTQQNAASIYVNEQKLTKTAVVLKSNATYSNIRTAEMGQEFDIVIPKTETYEAVASEGEVVFDAEKEHHMKWILNNLDEMKEYMLHLIGDNKEYQIILKYDHDQEEWTIQYKENVK